MTKESKIGLVLLPVVLGYIWVCYLFKLTNLQCFGLAIVLLIVSVELADLLNGKRKPPQESEIPEEKRLPREQSETPVNIERTFLAHSPAHFIVQYGLRLVVETIAGEGENRSLGNKPTQTVFAEAYNQDVFLRFLQENSYRFHLSWSKATIVSQTEEPFAGKADVFREVAGEMFFRTVHASKLEEQLRDTVLTRDSCRVSINKIVQNVFPEELIERNYAMLTKEQREESEAEERYREFDEILTVAALKRRLEFYQARNRHAYDSSWASIKTERVGRGLKISWQFKASAPSGCDLVGFRKTGGFAPDQYDEAKNGTLVIQSRDNNEVTEFLNEGETYFYTLYMKPWKHDDSTRYPVARFQITLTGDETGKLETLIRRVEEKEMATKARLRAEIMAEPKIVEENPIDPALEKISEVKTKLEGVFRFHEAMDNMEKAGIADVKRMGLSKREQEEKIEFIRDIVRRQREEYDS